MHLAVTLVIWRSMPVAPRWKACNDSPAKRVSITMDRPRRMGHAPSTSAVALAVVMAAAAFSAEAQQGDTAVGHAFAREACRACHEVEAKEPSPRMIKIGPAFRDIANAPGMTATALRVFLTSSHPKMPNFILTPEEIADVTAYIVSLRDHR